MLFTFIALFVLLLPTSLGENPGLRAAITIKGLNYICHSGINILQKALPTLTIPDIFGKVKLPLHIDLKYTISQLKLHNLVIPVCDNVPSSSSNSITLHSSGMSVQITGLAAITVFGRKVSNDIVVELNSVSLAISIKISRDVSNGHATLTFTACSAGVGIVQVSFPGLFSWLNKFLSEKVEGIIKSDFHSVFCSVVTNKLNENVNKALEAIPLVTKIDNIFVFNYTLTEDPVYTSEYVAAFLKGEFQPIGHPDAEAPFSPAPLPLIRLDGQMLYVWLTDYTLNTAGYVLKHAGRLSFTITPQLIPKEDILNTSTFRLLVPKLYHHFPNMAMQIVLEAIKPPHFKTSSKMGKLVIFGNVTFEVILPNGSIVTAFTLSGSLYMDMVAKIHAGGLAIITVNVTHLNAIFSLSSSNIGQIDVTPLQDGVNLFLTVFAIPAINQRGSKGFKIPPFNGISFINPHLSFGEGYILLSSDVNYNGKSF